MAEIFYERGKKYNCKVNGKSYFRKTATIDGKRRNFYGDGEKDANRKIAEAISLASQGVNLDHKNANVDEVFEYWLYNVKRVGVKASTFARYEGSFRNYIKGSSLAMMKLSKLTSANMQAYINYMDEELNASAPTIKATIKVWKLFTSWAYEEGYFPKDPCRNVSLPSSREPKKGIDIFTAEERDKILATMKAEDYQYDTLIRLAFMTGMRQGELLGLRWEDITDNGISITRSTSVVTHIDANQNRQRYREVWDTKTKNAVRVIPILDSTRQMLREHKVAQAKYFLKNRIKNEGYVFTNDVGSIIDASVLRKSYARLLERAGVPYRKFHAIRHTFGTEAIRRGVNVQDLKMLMGHSDIKTTYIYVQSDTESKKNAIEQIGEII